MAVLLENQAKELLKEANTMASGDVQGFAAVAFPIVRRVFAGLIANDLVSVQPMSLPSGLVFFMDFKRANNVGNVTSNLVGDAAYTSGSSFFGDRLGVQVTGGIRVDGVDNAEKGYYNLGSGYNKARYYNNVTASNVNVVTSSAIAGADPAVQKLIRFDQDILNDSVYTHVAVVQIPLTSAAVGAELAGLLAEQDVFSVSLANLSTAVTNGTGDYTGANLEATNHKVIRRLARVVQSGTAGTANGVKCLELVLVKTSGFSVSGGKLIEATSQNYVVSLPIKDKLDNVGVNALGATFATNPWTLEGSPDLPEIELKVDSFSITARSRKLKASWTPELGQDLNAYHNLDAEVELTSMLSEQIGLEIDQEILNDIVKGATASTKYWSRRPGKFVNRDTGADLQILLIHPC